MSEFWKRTIFGAIYVACVVGSILWHPIAFGVLFGMFVVLAVNEYLLLVNAPSLLRHVGIAAAVVLWLATLFGLLPFCDMSEGYQQIRPIGILVTLSVYVVLIFAALIGELWSKAENPIANWGNLLISQLMVALPFCTMACLYGFDNKLLLALFVLIWVNDTGAYCVGSLTAKQKGGNHKMFPRVSPKKSWEGLFGGFAFAIGAAFIMHHFGWFEALTTGSIALDKGLACLFGLLACIFGTLGDLMESLLKRTIGVKDSGRFLPGHGGVLDRFDSMLLAAPVLTLFTCLCFVLLLSC